MKVVKKIFKWLLISLSIILLLLILTVLFLQTNKGQSILRKQAVQFLSDKLGTRVVVDHINTNFLTHLEIKQITVEDKAGQELLYIGKIEARYRLFDLLKNKLSISAISIDTIYFRIARNENDKAFNFDFIIQAFSDSAASEKVSDTSKSTLQFDFGKLNVSQLHFLMDDKRAQQFYDVKGNKIDVAINKIDFSNQLYDIAYFKSVGLTAKINQGIALYKDEEKANSDGLLPIIKFNKLSLLKNSIAIDIKSSGLNSKSKIENFIIDGAALNLNEYKLNIKQLEIDNHQSEVLIKTINEKLNKAEVVKTDSDSKPFVFAVEKIQLRNNNLSYDKDKIISKTTVDFNADHIHLKKLQLELNNLSYDGIHFKGQLKNLTAKEQCGLDLQQLSTNFNYAANGIIIDQLKLKTPYSTVNGTLSTSYESLASVIANPEKLKLQIKLNPLLIGKNDLKHFVAYADINAQLKSIMSEDIFIEGDVKGSVADLKIVKLKIKNDDITISVSGNLSGLPAIEKLNGSIKIEEISGTAENVLKLLPPQTVPDNISIPDKFSVNGTIAGQKGDYDLDLVLNSTDGDLSINGSVLNPDKVENISFNIHLQSDGIQLDRILKDTLFGNTTFDIHAKGLGIKPETATLETTASVPFFHYQGHDYKNINLTALLDDALLVAKYVINDSACKMDAAASFSFDTFNPYITTNAHIDIIDFRELGFTTDSLKIKGDINTDSLNVNSKHINGTADLSNIVITKGLINYSLDTITLKATHVDSAQTLAIHAPFLDFKLDGAYEINALQTLVKNLLLNYLIKADLKSDTIPDAVATIDGGLRYHPIIEAFMPGLTSFSAIKFSGTINSKADELMISVLMPEAVYNDILIDSTVLMINTISDSLKISLTTDGIDKDPVMLHKTQLSSWAKDGVLTWNFNSYNFNDTLIYNLNGIFINDTAALNISLGENQLINKQAWDVNKGNKIDYDFNKGMIANLQLSSGNKKLSVISATDNNGLPVVLQLTDFPISTISKIANADSTFAEGLINGEASLTALNPMQFTATITIDSLNVLGAPYGNLSLDANNKNGFAGDLKLKGTEVDFDLKAGLSVDSVLSGDLNVNRINIKVMQPFIQKYFSNTNGILQGKLTLGGIYNRPVLKGDLKVKDLTGFYNDYGTYFSIPDETISFSENGVTLNNFNVFDSLKNTAIIDGNLNLLTISEYTYNFSVKTNHFLALNNKSNAEQTIYGPAFLTSDIKLSSRSNIITIDGKVKIDEKSIINVELSNTDTSVAISNGVILYYDQTISADTILVNKILADSMLHVDDLKLNMKLDFEITKTSKLNIMLNKATGDYLNVYGDANISIEQLPGRDLTLNGKFTIDHGEYLLSISQFVKRKFEVVKDSYIKWSGVPTDADINLEALYNIEAAVAPLLSGSQTSNDESYQQRLPFELYLTLKEKLLQPKISFRLDMPVKDQNAFSGAVYARIKQINLQEAELNKQSMGLLIFKQFIPQDPMANSNSGYSLVDVGSAARNTAGEILSSQLNSLMASHVKAVDVSFDFESTSDYSTGSKVDETDLTVNLSKSLFNDRATVKIGSTFALSGSEAHKQNAAGLAGDVAVEYKLTKNGRYRVKVYSLNQYDSTIEGEVVQTGVSFVIILDFNTFREMFHSEKNKN